MTKGRKRAAERVEEVDKGIRGVRDCFEEYRAKGELRVDLICMDSDVSISNDGPPLSAAHWNDFRPKMDAIYTSREGQKNRYWSNVSMTTRGGVIGIRMMTTVARRHGCQQLDDVPKGLAALAHPKATCTRSREGGGTGELSIKRVG